MGYKIVSTGSINGQRHSVGNKKEEGNKADRESSRNSSHSSILEDIIESIFD